MNQRISFVETRRHINRVRREDVFCLKPASGWVWAQRICIWVLRKLNCQWYEEVESYTRHVIDTDDFIKNLSLQHKGILDHCHREAGRLLMGAEDFQDLMSSPLVSQQMQFMASYAYAEHGRREIFGLEVTIIPWMKGILVMPRGD